MKRSLIPPLALLLVIGMARRLEMQATALGGLVGSWHFDSIDTTGSPWTTPDSSGNGNTGSLYPSGSGPALVTGISNSALDFDGIDDYVEVASPVSLSFSSRTPVTFDAWVYNKAALAEPEDLRVILERSDGWSNGYAFTYGLLHYPQYPHYVVWSGFYNGREGFTSFEIKPDQWYQLRAVYNGSAASDGSWVIYVDGVAQETTTIGSGSGATGPSTSLLIGKSSPGNGRYHKGVIDEVRIWDTALPPDSNGAVQLTRLTAGRSAPAVVLEWETATEFNHAGFRIFREEPGGRLANLTPRLIAPASAGGELGGATYRYVDRQAPWRSTRYWLEDVDTNGTVTRHGPVEAPAYWPRLLPPHEPLLPRWLH